MENEVEHTLALYSKAVTISTFLNVLAECPCCLKMWVKIERLTNCDVTFQVLSKTCVTRKAWVVQIMHPFLTEKLFVAS